MWHHVNLIQFFSTFKCVLYYIYTVGFFGQLCLSHAHRPRAMGPQVEDEAPQDGGIPEDQELLHQTSTLVR